MNIQSQETALPVQRELKSTHVKLKLCRKIKEASEHYIKWSQSDAETRILPVLSYINGRQTIWIKWRSNEVNEIMNMNNIIFTNKILFLKIHWLIRKQ